MHLSVAELATLWMPPTASFGASVERLPSQWLPAPAEAFIDPNNPYHIAMGYGRRSDGTWAPIGMDYRDFRFVFHMTAAMGRGKTEWLKNLLAELLRVGAGFMAFDCKGEDFVNGAIPLIPLAREKDVTILNLGGTTVTGEDLRASMNLFSRSFGISLGMDYSKLASTILRIFASLDSKFDESIGIKQFANMGTLALLEGEPRATLMHLVRFFGDEDYRLEVCSRVRNMQVKDFWERRFEAMPESQKSSLSAFERRIDQILAYPELSSMMVAPGCSIDMRRLMDNKGILLTGVKATEGDIASIAGTLLLTQMTIAALSRTNVPESERDDWPVIIDEAQIVLEQNVELANLIYAQLRGMRIGSAAIHQAMKQIASIEGVLVNNTGIRGFLGAEVLDAQRFASEYASSGLTASDFINMPRFQQQYLRLVNGSLFAARPLPLVQPINEPAPEVVKANWQTIKAQARNAQEQKIDDAIARFRELARIRPDEAIQRLGQLPDAAFDAYCARTKAHREAQRAFIIDNPGCIPVESGLPPEAARVQQKVQRIRILSALGAGIPKLETDAMQWKLLMAAREAGERKAAREAAEKAAKKGSRSSGGSSKQAPARAAAPSMVAAATGDTTPLNPNAQTRLRDEAGQPMPTIDQLLAERGARRSADDIADGFDAFED